MDKRERSRSGMPLIEDVRRRSLIDHLAELEAAGWLVMREVPTEGGETYLRVDLTPKGRLEIQAAGRVLP